MVDRHVARQAAKRSAVFVVGLLVAGTVRAMLPAFVGAVLNATFACLLVRASARTC